MPEHPRKSAKKKATSKTTAPIAKGAKTPPPFTRRGRFTMPTVPKTPRAEEERLPMDERDLTEPDDLEIWIAEELRDWQLEIGAVEFEKLCTVMEAELKAAKEKRADIIGMEPRAIGYIEGQINTYEHLLGQMRRAIAARRDRIGEAVRRDA